MKDVAPLPESVKWKRTDCFGGGGEINVISYLFSFFCSLCVLLGFYRCHYFAFECENLLIRRIFKKLKLAQNFVIFRNNLDNNDKKNIEALFFKYVHE